MQVNADEKRGYKRIMNNSKPIVVLCGKSGSGKDYLANCFNLKRNVGNTTRQARKNEKDYNYYTKDYYLNDVDKSKIVTPTLYNDNYYWVWLKDFESEKFEYTVANFEGIRDLYNDINSGKITRKVKFIYVKCSLVKRIKNMRKRGDTFKDILKRLRTDKIEFKGAEDFVVNELKGKLIKM